MDEGRVALITDALSGIGTTTARLFAKQGYKVSLAGNDKESIDKVARECTELSPHSFEMLALVVDLGNLNNAELVVQKTEERFGRLDVLINNSGVYHRIRPGDRLSYDLYKDTMTTNVDSVVRTSMEAVPHLEKNNGSIVFVSSVLAAISSTPENYAYCMSHVAISKYAKCLALDVAPKIRINIVSPGLMSAPSLENIDAPDVRPASGRIRVGPDMAFRSSGDIDRIAGTIYYLASDEAAFVNGAEFYLDRGKICMVGEEN